MRLSVVESDPGFNRSEAYSARVYLDDVEVTRDCRTADDATGDVHLIDREATERAGHAVEIVKHGRVRIVLAP